MKDNNTCNPPKALMLASVASMIDLFNEDNINILKSLGYEVHVMANFSNGSITSDERVKEFKQELIDNGINVTDVPIPRSLFKIRSIISSYKMIKKAVSNDNYKVVHCHSPIGGVLCRLACKNARKKGTKVLYTAHGFHFFDGAPLANWLLFYPIEKLCSRYTDKLITINNEDYTRAKKWGTVPVEYVPGIGVNTEKFKIQSKNSASIRNELGLSEKDFVLMSTGQISVRKNHEVVIRAIHKINNSKVKYLIVGTGELENKLRDLARELNVEKQIIFAGYRRDISDLLHSVDAFVFPSLQEGLPVALMEAMASGLPIICSKIRGNIDLITDGEGGYLAEAKDVDGFSSAIKKLIDNYDNLYEMRDININMMNRFDVSVINEQMRKIYSDVNQ